MSSAASRCCARAAADAPGLPLSEVRASLEAGEDDADLAGYVAKEQTAFAGLLADVGHPAAAVGHLARVRDQVGALAVPRFVAGRARRAARNVLPGR